MLYKTKTDLPLESVKSQLEEKAKAIGFGVLGHYDFKSILESKGFPIEHEVTVYELCNPAGAQKALRAAQDISVYLPCRLSIYEDDGQTVLSTIGVDAIVDGVGGDEELKAFMMDIFDHIKGLMDSF